MAVVRLAHATITFTRPSDDDTCRHGYVGVDVDSADPDAEVLRHHAALDEPVTGRLARWVDTLGWLVGTLRHRPSSHPISHTGSLIIDNRPGHLMWWSIRITGPDATSYTPRIDTAVVATIGATRYRCPVPMDVADLWQLYETVCCWSASLRNGYPCVLDVLDDNCPHAHRHTVAPAAAGAVR